MVRRPNHVGNLLEVEGIVQRISLIDRSLAVGLGTSQMLFDVAPACVVRLNGERVKLRMLQPGDRVRIGYRVSPAGRTAVSVEARTRAPLAIRVS